MGGGEVRQLQMIATNNEQCTIKDCNSERNLLHSGVVSEPNSYTFVINHGAPNLLVALPHFCCRNLLLLQPVRDLK